MNNGTSSNGEELQGRLRRALGVDSDLAGESAERASRRLLARVQREELADVRYAPVDSPFGELLAAVSRKGLLRLAFPEESMDSVLERIARSVSPRIVESPPAVEELQRELDEYFEGYRRAFEVPLDRSLIRGPFGQRVLEATAEIPFGGVLSYTEVATEAGSPRASRAAGNALGSNPIPIVIPCHRVLHRGGGLGGYGGGLPRKRWLLELEGALPRTG
jgi:methylated-DNA-[protein]-cysteine S-methyltransferase